MAHEIVRELQTDYHPTFASLQKVLMIFLLSWASDVHCKDYWLIQERC